MAVFTASPFTSYVATPRSAAIVAFGTAPAVPAPIHFALSSQPANNKGASSALRQATQPATGIGAVPATPGLNAPLTTAFRVRRSALGHEVVPAPPPPVDLFPQGALSARHASPLTSRGRQPPQPQQPQQPQQQMVVVPPPAAAKQTPLQIQLLNPPTKGSQGIRPGLTALDFVRSATSPQRSRAVSPTPNSANPVVRSMSPTPISGLLAPSRSMSPTPLGAPSRSMSPTPAARAVSPTPFSGAPLAPSRSMSPTPVSVRSMSPRPGAVSPTPQQRQQQQLVLHSPRQEPAQVVAQEPAKRLAYRRAQSAPYPLGITPLPRGVVPQIAPKGPTCMEPLEVPSWLHRCNDFQTTALDQLTRGAPRAIPNRNDPLRRPALWHELPGATKDPNEYMIGGLPAPSQYTSQGR